MKYSKKRYNLIKSGLIVIITALSIGLTGCHGSKKSVAKEDHVVVEKIDKGREKNKIKNQSKKGIAIVEEAMTWLGTPYGYAKSDKGIATDCSGMVMKVYETVNGLKIPRNSAKQAEFCKPLEKNNVRIGDLVFFATGRDPERISHVGIMVDELSFIHASTKKGVVISKINEPYYIRTFIMFGRPE